MFKATIPPARASASPNINKKQVANGAARLIARLSLLSATLVSAAALAAPAAAQTSGNFVTVNGRIHDMSVAANGQLLYCTEQREVGQVTLSSQVSILADATSGPFSNPLRGICTMPSGDIAIIDAIGDIYRLPAGNTPAVKVYSDLYMVSDPTDLICDSAGNFVTVSQSPSSGFRAVNWMSSDGVRWAYYVVKHQPIAITQNPFTGNLVIADMANGGKLRMLDAADDSHPTTDLAPSTSFGFTNTNNDGDLAYEADGNLLIASGGTVYRYNCTTGAVSTLLSGLGNVHALVIAQSSGNLPSASGYSAYVAKGTGPTTIVEIANVNGPQTTLGPSLGLVPDRGKQVTVNWGMNVFEILRDDNNNLLLGGDVWGANQAIKRLNLSTMQLTTVATAAQGLAGRVLGMAQAADGSIYCVSTEGVVQRVVESPLSISTIWGDGANQIVNAEDMILDRSGTVYVASRQDWAVGFVTKIENSTLTHLTPTLETRGLCADPSTGRMAVAEWVNIGFNGKVHLFNFNNNTLEFLPNFEGVNYSNAGVWADGDLVEDVEGNIYTCSEDDFSVYKYNRKTSKVSRIGAGYLYHPAGLAIAKSTAGSGSTTGWSLYVAEYVFLWEIPSVPAPAGTLLDKGAPPAGKSLGYFPPASGTLRTLVGDPAGGGFYVSTSGATIERMSMTGVRSVVASSAQGLSGDIVGLAAKSNGHLIAGNRFGVIYDVDPNSNYSAVAIYNNPNNTITDLRSVSVDGQDRPILFDRPVTDLNVARVYRLESGQLTSLATTNRGYRGSFDPLTGDLFVAEAGSAVDGGGEFLRIDGFANPPTSGHFRGNAFFVLPFGGFDATVAFASNGDFYSPVSSKGRVYKVNRATGALSIAAAQYSKPIAAVIAPGTAGIAGPQGSSLFVLDSGVIYETGISGSPAAFPSSTKPNLAPPADLRVSGDFQLGGVTPIHIESPADSNRIYLVLASLSGKVPGYAINAFGDPNDPRIIPNNPDFLWQLINSPQVFPDFYNILDATGNSPGSMAIITPNDPSLLIHQFIDFTWVAIQLGYPNGFATIGGTAQVYLSH
jgi:hypothetical protein